MSSKLPDPADPNDPPLPAPAIAGLSGFTCTLCAECCRGRQVVRLNGDDLQLLAEHAGLADEAALAATGLIEHVHEEPGFSRPRLRFRSRPLRFCPFLQNDLGEDGCLRGLCALHPRFKPLVCHLAPLAREVEDDGASFTETWRMVAPVEGCPGMGRGSEPSLPVGEIRRRLDREVDWMRWRLGQAGQ